MKILEAIGTSVNVDSTRWRTAFYYAAKFFGLAPFILKNEQFHPAGIFGKVYALILIVLFITWTIICNSISQSQFGNGLYHFVILVMFFFITARVCTAIFILAFRSNEIVDILNKVNVVEDELASFDSQQSRKGYFIKMSMKIIATNLAVLVLKNIAFYINYPDADGFMWIESFIGNIIAHNTIMIFVETLLRIKRNFELLNKLLREIHRPKYEVISTEMQGTSVFAAARPQHQFSVERFEKLRKLHRELSELIESATSVMTVPIFFAGAYYVSQILAFSYTSYAVVSTFDSASTENLVSIIKRIGLRLGVIIIELFPIAEASSSTCVMASETNEVLVKMWNKYRPHEIHDEFLMFSLQLLHSPVTVSLFGFLDLGYSFMYKILCAAVTYFVILVQLDTSPTDNDV